MSFFIESESRKFWSSSENFSDRTSISVGIAGGVRIWMFSWSIGWKLKFSDWIQRWKTPIILKFFFDQTLIHFDRSQANLRESVAFTLLACSLWWKRVHRSVCFLPIPKTNFPLRDKRLNFISITITVYVLYSWSDFSQQISLLFVLLKLCLDVKVRVWYSVFIVYFGAFW